MKKVNISFVLFCDNKGNILLQDRREISKYGEEYGFFGGGIEKGETPEGTLKREIKEELGIRLNDFAFFRYYLDINNVLGHEAHRWVYIAPMPNLESLTVSEGKLALMKFEDSFNLKMLSGHIDTLKDIYNTLKQTFKNK